MPEDWNPLPSFTVSGIIINDPNGPKRWCQEIKAATAREAEDAARSMVEAVVVEGRYGILWVANVLQLDIQDSGTGIMAADTYAVYADDPDRREGFVPSGGYTPPSGFEGYL